MNNAVSRAASILVLAVPLIIGAAKSDADLRGTWDVHIEHMSGRVVNEQWVLEQEGPQIRGKVTMAQRDYPLEGTVNGGQIQIKVTVTADRYNLFRGTWDGESIKGAIEQKGDNGTFSAIRTRPQSR